MHLKNLPRDQKSNKENLKEKLKINYKNTKNATKVDKWIAYRDSGRQEHSIQIKLLTEELVDCQQNFEEMKSHLENLSLAKEEIKRSTEDRLSDQKYVASEKAMTTLDKWTSKEVKDNDWLRRETDLHRQEVGHLKQTVETLEKENLEIMSGLFDCRIDDLKISRKFFLTRFKKRELDETGILETDLSKLKLKKDSELEYIKQQRPQSATSKAVERKVFSLHVGISEAGESGEEDENSKDEDGDPLDNYLTYEDDDFDEYLQLGPVELKLLQVVGEKKPIHPPEKLTNEEEQAKMSAPDVWPVTPSMLKAATE
ncbi:putative coiled-coil domain-containing protein [Apostichopus japonicus]|uniref:Putative coiled-coil domain-containing protein n=1 Tax=Stichopus japonicus TaxID=307972 RepID=A0A2G8KXT0_STIJA|nr:putative coiled-coil domain-containing protein [Apostichopus japonicus]